MNLAIAKVILFLAVGAPRAALSGTISVDSIAVNTMGGQPTSNGITFSSSAFLSAGSSLTLQGNSGYIEGFSSATASAFFGDGSNLLGVALLSSTQTFSGAQSFASSFTVQSGGRQITLSTSTSSSNISISAAGVVSFFPQLHNSSHTILPDYQTTNHSLGVCVDGSTLTITTTGGRVELQLAASVARQDGGEPVISFLQDGQFVNDLSSTTGIAGMRGGFEYLTPFDYIVNAPVSGVHSYCITFASMAASTSYLRNNSTESNIFYIKEVK